MSISLSPGIQVDSQIQPGSQLDQAQKAHEAADAAFRAHKMRIHSLTDEAAQLSAFLTRATLDTTTPEEFVLKQAQHELTLRTIHALEHQQRQLELNLTNTAHAAGHLRSMYYALVDTLENGRFIPGEQIGMQAQLKAMIKTR